MLTTLSYIQIFYISYRSYDFFRIKDQKEKKEER